MFDTEKHCISRARANTHPRTPMMVRANLVDCCRTDRVETKGTKTKWKTKLAILLIREKRFAVSKLYKKKKKKRMFGTYFRLVLACPLNHRPLPPTPHLAAIALFSSFENFVINEIVDKTNWAGGGSGDGGNDSGDGGSGSDWNKWKSTYSHSMLFDTHVIIITTILRAVIHTYRHRLYNVYLCLLTHIQ